MFVAEADSLVAGVLDYADALDRIEAGRSYGDGEVNTYLAIELTDAGIPFGEPGGLSGGIAPEATLPLEGRFAARPSYLVHNFAGQLSAAAQAPVDEDDPTIGRLWTGLNYLPRLASAYHGERQTWSFTWEPAIDVACNAEWRIGYRVDASTALPNYGAVIERQLMGLPDWGFAAETKQLPFPFDQPTYPLTAAATVPLEITDETPHIDLPGVVPTGAYFHTRLEAVPPAPRPEGPAMPFVYDASDGETRGLRVGWVLLETRPGTGDESESVETALQRRRASLAWFVVRPEGCGAVATADAPSFHPAVVDWYQQITCYLAGGGRLACRPADLPRSSALPLGLLEYTP
jgi:hypothetical protein